MKKVLLYFGCMRDKGHYLFESERSGSLMQDRLPSNIIIPNFNKRVLFGIDSTYCPMDGVNYAPEGYYNECVIPPLRILAWWDYSVDQRPGSNSNLIGYGYESAEEILLAADIIFPSVMKRQKIRPTPFNK